jgi:hypothetical protein
MTQPNGRARATDAPRRAPPAPSEKIGASSCEFLDK